jgi:phage terminase small subunit
LTNVDIKTYIDEQLEKIHNEKIADAKEVMITPYGVWIETLIKLMLKALFQL